MCLVLDIYTNYTIFLPTITNRRMENSSLSLLEE
jgi:hypothetical protein